METQYLFCKQEFPALGMQALRGVSSFKAWANNRETVAPKSSVQPRSLEIVVFLAKIGSGPEFEDCVYSTYKDVNLGDT